MAGPLGSGIVSDDVTSRTVFPRRCQPICRPLSRIPFLSNQRESAGLSRRSAPLSTQARPSELARNRALLRANGSERPGTSFQFTRRFSKDREFREQQELLTQAAQQTDQFSEVLYKNGGASYLQVLTSETNYFSAELNLVQAKLNERLALVQLYCNESHCSPPKVSGDSPAAFSDSFPV